MEDCFMDDIDVGYKTFEKILPYFMSVLVHLKMHHPGDDREDLYAGIDSIDFFNFDSDIEVMELFQSIEILFQLGDEEAFDQFLAHPHCDFFITTMMQQLKKTSEFVTVIDLK